jgi:hypothetical protein
MDVNRDNMNKWTAPQYHVRNAVVAPSPHVLDYRNGFEFKRPDAPSLMNGAFIIPPPDIGYSFGANPMDHVNGHSGCYRAQNNHVDRNPSYSIALTQIPKPSEPNQHHYLSNGSTLNVLNNSLKGDFHVNILRHLPVLSSNLPDGQLVFHDTTQLPASGLAPNGLQTHDPPDKTFKFSERFYKLKFFRVLAITISKILKDEDLPAAVYKLSGEEREILCAFLNKRYRLKDSQRLSKDSVLSNDCLMDLPQILKKYNCGKRKEENMKLIFNWVFKFLKTQIAASCTLKPSKDELDYLFYTYYFRQVAEENGLSIISFYKPNFVKPVKNSEKTFNASFIKNIQLSEHFMQDFNLALDEYMLSEYKDVIDKKLSAIFVKWEAKAEKDDFSSQSLLSLARSIAGSQKYKLPWTLTEIQLAIACVKSELNNRL